MLNFRDESRRVFVEYSRQGTDSFTYSVHGHIYHIPHLFPSLSLSFISFRSVSTSLFFLSLALDTHTYTHTQTRTHAGIIFVFLPPDSLIIFTEESFSRVFEISVSIRNVMERRRLSFRSAFSLSFFGAAFHRSRFEIRDPKRGILKKFIVSPLGTGTKKRVFFSLSLSLSLSPSRTLIYRTRTIVERKEIFVGSKKEHREKI